jgi:hypothetical protein
VGKVVAEGMISSVGRTVGAVVTGEEQERRKSKRKEERAIRKLEEYCMASILTDWMCFPVHDE